MSSKSFHIPEIGEVIVKKHYNAKRIIIKLKKDQAPSVTIPKLMPFKMGLSFASEKRDWIIKQQKTLNAIQSELKVYGTSTIFKTRFCEIHFQYFKGGRIASHFKNNCYYLLFPEKEHIESASNQIIVKQFVIETLRREAKKYLPLRTQELSDRYKFSYKKVFIKNLKSRWGSCSSQNNINLNLHLMRLPENLSDFIILHELCHTIHKNHGKEFHQLLNSLVGNEKDLEKELKKYNVYL